MIWDRQWSLKYFLSSSLETHQITCHLIWRGTSTAPDVITEFLMVEIVNTQQLGNGLHHFLFQLGAKLARILVENYSPSSFEMWGAFSSDADKILPLSIVHYHMCTLFLQLQSLIKTCLMERSVIYAISINESKRKKKHRPEQSAPSFMLPAPHSLLVVGWEARVPLLVPEQNWTFAEQSVWAFQKRRHSTYLVINESFGVPGPCGL